MSVMQVCRSRKVKSRINNTGKQCIQSLTIIVRGYNREKDKPNMGPAMLLHGNIKSHVNKPKKVLSKSISIQHFLSVEIII